MLVENIGKELVKLRNKNTLMPKMYSFTEVRNIVAYLDRELEVADDRWKRAENLIKDHQDEMGNWLTK